MKAAVLYGREDIRVDKVEVRPLQRGEVRLHIEAALTCGTDLKVFKRGYHAKMIIPPAAFGHELAGVIIETRSEKWAVGQRVAPANSAPCGRCHSCNRGQENLCDDLLFLNGAYAQSIVVPARIVDKNLLALKPETDFPSAALTEPLACVVLGAQEAGLRAGQNVLVIGSGPIGLMFVRLASHIGCRVSLIGRGSNRLEAAQRLGASHILESNTTDVLKQQLKEKGLGPYEAVIEAVGKPEAWETAVGLVGKGGIVNLFGGCPAGSTITIDTAWLHYSSVRICSSFHHTPATLRRALDLVESGVIRARDFVDGECPLSQLPDLFRSMAAGNRAVKTLVRVDA